MPETVYITASAHDARFTRICIASVRHWYPNVSVRLLRGGTVDPGLIYEAKKYWGVEVADVPLGNYGWGFVKLEPLFGSAGHKFLVLDSDTVMAGPVLDRLRGCGAQFVVDKEEQTVSRAAQIYWDPSQAFGHGIELPQSPAYFNTGQWVGTSGIIGRTEFERFLEWSLPRKVKFPSVFKNGEQGILNYVVNMLQAAGRLSLDRVPFMVWPGAPAKDGGQDYLAGRFDGSQGRIIHWAGFKNPKFEKLPGWALLQHFEKLYYSKIPGGEALRTKRAWGWVWGHRWRKLKLKLKWLMPA